MASIAQLVSEIAHSISQPNNAVLRQNLKDLIIHTRNEIIRRSYENHGYVDKGLVQRFKIHLIDVPDGDIELPKEINIREDIDNSFNTHRFNINYVNVRMIKRSRHKIPKPIRLPNNLPFDRVSSVGFQTSLSIPFVKETSVRFKNALPGMCGLPSYDYINGYIYVFPSNNSFDLKQIIIESAFEHPTEIQVHNHEIDEMDAFMDNNEFLLSEDMIGQIKEIITKRDLLSNVRQTNEIPETIKY